MKEQVIDPLSIVSRLVTLMVCSILISAKHPVEQFQLKVLLAGRKGVTKHVRLILDPIRYPKVLLFLLTGTPRGLVTIST